jgi:hypothetical protein
MATYTLNTSFTAQDLSRFLATGSNLVVAKPSASGGAPNVAWVVYAPWENNTMTWAEEYGIYASTASLVNGALLTQMSRSEFPALDGKTYPFTPNGAFGAPEQGGQPGSFYAFNAYQNATGYLTFGLFQDALINGTPASGNAISAAPVLYNSTAQMTPFTTIYLWVQSQVQSNSVVTLVTSPMTKVTFGGGVTSISLAYDSQTGTFVPQGKAKLSEGLVLDQIAPSLF